MAIKKPKKPVKLTQDELDRKTMEEVEAMREQLARQLRGVNIEEAIAKLTPEKRSDFVRKQERFRELYAGAKCRLNFMEFVRAMWPSFIEGAHFGEMAKVFQRIDAGEAVRVVINIAPRFGKSEILSFLFPSWFIGKHPDRQIIQASNVLSLAEDFGGKIRNLVKTEEYMKMFPGVALSGDSKAKGHFNTNKGGRYFAVGAGGSAIGRGADLFICDDPHGEQQSIASGNENVMPPKEAFEKTYNWFGQMMMRLQPNASVIIVMQRWAPFDLTGRLIEDSKKSSKALKWEVITLPALFHREDENGSLMYDENREPIWDALWPAYWSVDKMIKKRDNMPSWRWEAQYMQDPTSETSSIIKRTDWKPWGEREDGTINYDLPEPDCEFIIQAWDTAFSEKTSSDYSACTTWGVFQTTGKDGRPTKALILFNAWRGQVEFPELKKMVRLKYKELKPDACIVEARATGMPLIQELRREGIPISSYTPSWQTGDKITRLNSVSDLFASGMVYYAPRDWAREVIDEVALFPRGQNDDYVDTVSMALIRFRAGGLISMPSEEEDEEDEQDYQPRRAAYAWGSI